MGVRGVALAWLAGIGIMSWRTWHKYRQPPVPGRILAASGVFAGLALVTEYPPAAAAATLAAWGFDLAILFSLGPAALTGEKTKTPAKTGPQPVLKGP